MFYVKQNTVARTAQPCEHLSHSSVTTSGQTVLLVPPQTVAQPAEVLENIEFIYICSRHLTDGFGNKEEVQNNSVLAILELISST